MDQLERECRSYTQYLTGYPAGEYVIDKYRDFHRKPDKLAAWKRDAFDQFLVEFSARGPYCARLADTYASQFLKSSAVRKKLVLTLAILECVPPSCEWLDDVDRGGRIAAAARLGLVAFRYAARLCVAVVLFTPARLGLAVTRRSRQAAVAQP